MSAAMTAKKQSYAPSVTACAAKTNANGIGLAVADTY
jgi:hypothetical protein